MKYMTGSVQIKYIHYANQYIFAIKYTQLDYKPLLKPITYLPTFAENHFGSD